MKQLFQSVLVGLIALQGLACAGGAGVDAEDTEPGADAAQDIDLLLVDVEPEDEAGEEPDAPQGVALLSPSERDEQTSALTASAEGETDAPLDDIPLRSQLHVQGPSSANSGPELELSRRRGLGRPIVGMADPASDTGNAPGNL